MSVFGIEVAVGQSWRNLAGDLVVIDAEFPDDPFPFYVHAGRDLHYSVNLSGVANILASTLSLATLCADTSAPETKDTNPKDAIGVRKAPMSTVSAAVLAELGVAMLEGAVKYGKFNARVLGVRSSVYYDATMRHLLAWFEGEDIDPDSGLSHVTKAIASLVVLRDAMIHKNVTDDRPPSTPEFYTRLNALAASILDKHKSRSPFHYTISNSKVESGS